MNTAELIVTALSVGKVASRRQPGSPVVNDAYDRLQGTLAVKIGEDAARLLHEALTGMPDDDIEWLRRFTQETGMADEPRLYTAALNAIGALLVWVAAHHRADSGLLLDGRYRLSWEPTAERLSITGGDQPLTLDLNGHFQGLDLSLSSASLADLGVMLDAILAQSLLP